MAKAKSKKEAEQTPQSNDDVFFSHNDESALAFPPDKQCQCEDCKAFRAAHASWNSCPSREARTLSIEPSRVAISVRRLPIDPWNSPRRHGSQT